MLGSLDDLVNAARGKMPARVTPTEPKPPTPTNSDYQDALQRRSMLGQSYTQLATNTGKYGINEEGRLSGSYGKAFSEASTASPTKTFANILAGTGRTSTGTGKYGGFSNAGDLQTAIAGAAMGLRGNVVPALRSAAESRYSQLEPMYSKALGGQTGFTTEYNPGRASAGNFRIAEELASNPTYRQQAKNVREYFPILGSWYKEQAAPAEEYLKTAQQIERTPLSELASSIAVRGYGMDPNLAAGRFSNLDNEYAIRMRDQESIANTGLPYEQAKFLAEQTAKQAKADKTAASDYATANIESFTGLSANRLSSTTGQSIAQIYDNLSKTYVVGDQKYTGAGAAQEIIGLLDAGDTKGARDLVEVLKSAPNGQSLSMVLNAMLKYYVSNQYKIDVDLTEAGM